MVKVSKKGAGFTGWGKRLNNFGQHEQDLQEQDLQEQDLQDLNIGDTISNSEQDLLDVEV